MQYGSVEEETEPWRQRVLEDAVWREQNGLPRDSAIVSTAIAVIASDQGYVYVLLDELRNASGECPVAFVDHETLELGSIVASTYERFMWFFIDDISRKADRTGEVILDEDEIPPRAWPFENKAWMLEHDPGLAKWL